MLWTQEHWLPLFTLTFKPTQLCHSPWIRKAMWDRSVLGFHSGQIHNSRNQPDKETNAATIEERKKENKNTVFRVLEKLNNNNSSGKEGEKPTVDRLLFLPFFTNFLHSFLLIYTSLFITSTATIATILTQNNNNISICQQHNQVIYLSS